MSRQRLWQKSGGVNVFQTRIGDVE